MRRIFVLILSLHCAAIRAETLIGEVQWEYAYVDLHQACQRYYSLYPPSVKCIEDNLYKVQYKITYGFGDQVRRVYLTYIPGPATRLDANGNIIPPDYAIKDRS